MVRIVNGLSCQWGLCTTMAKQSSGAGLWVIFGIIVLLLVIPREIWIALGIVAVIAFAIYHFAKVKASPAASEQSVPEDQGPTLAELTAAREVKSNRAAGASRSSTAAPEYSLPPQPAQNTPSLERRLDTVTRVAPAFAVPVPVDATPRLVQEFSAARVQAETARPTPSFAIPQAPAGMGTGRWVPQGETIEIAGIQIPSGMLYVGTRLQACNGRTDPCLINPLATVAALGSYAERQTDYWPSYSDITPQARRAYLNWLDQGRSDPACDLGYVFLFFYGLERRIIVDGAVDPASKQDWPAIAEELRRLLGIYGEGSGSFQRYASGLLSWIELDAPAEKLYLQPIPVKARSYELPMYLRLALGQASLDRAPIPPALAVAWVRQDPQIGLRTPATRCMEEFDQLFAIRYSAEFGEGLVLPKNRTKLKFAYQPASSSLYGQSIQSKSFGGIPDITVLTAPAKRLQEIVFECTEELSAFSRMVGKDPDSRKRLDGLLQLPIGLWPEETLSNLRTLASKTKEGPVTLSFKDLLAVLGGLPESFTKERTRALIKVLSGARVGVEPDVFAGAKTPVADDPIVLFEMPQDDSTASPSGAYQAAALTLQLASAVALADGSFSAKEEDHLASEIRQWSHLTDAHRTRLHAHLRWLTMTPMTLAGLKKKLEPLGLQAREVIAAFMATLVQADGVVTPAEVKFLEKVYKALGVDAKRVFSDIHAVGAGSAHISGSEGKSGFRLDTQRIAALQQDTERVTALLAGIFIEEEPVMPAPEPLAETESPASTGLLGLDEAHSALMRLLLSRPQWAREELEDAAADLELMLDGALEQINEASFEAYDLPFTEGEDPVEITAEVVEKMDA